MYSLIRVWIGAKLARMLIQLSVVVSTTSAIESPSAPSLYWMPKNGIQSTVVSNSKPSLPGRYATSRTSETTQARSANPSATGRADARRQDRDGDRADERHERDDGQDRQAGEVHGQRPTSTRYEPAMTISPTAMPRA